jgi:lactate dehydrogenase-like 2-hydroxyacid dehydrogenase
MSWASVWLTEGEADEAHWQLPPVAATIHVATATDDTVDADGLGSCYN